MQTSVTLASHTWNTQRHTSINPRCADAPQGQDVPCRALSSTISSAHPLYVGVRVDTAIFRSDTGRKGEIGGVSVSRQPCTKERQSNQEKVCTWCTLGLSLETGRLGRQDEKVRLEPVGFSDPPVPGERPGRLKMKVVVTGKRGDHPRGGTYSTHDARASSPREKQAV